MPRRLSQIWAVVRRDALIATTYRLTLVTRIVSVAFVAVILFYISKLIRSAPELAGFAGGYFEYALVGMAVMSVGGLGLRNFARTIATEQTAGTLEMLLAAPLRIGTLLTGTFVVPFFLTAIQLVGLLFVGIGLFGVGIPFERFLVALPVLVLTTMLFCAIGVISAAFMVVTKRRDPFAPAFMQVSGLLSGAIFPPSLFPGWVQDVIQAFPLFHSLKAMREALLSGGGFADVSSELLVLLGFTVIMVPLSVAIFTRALRLARVTGMLGTY
jgi:ABC-2 type transport system permease protein